MRLASRALHLALGSSAGFVILSRWGSLLIVFGDPNLFSCLAWTASIFRSCDTLAMAQKEISQQASAAKAEQGVPDDGSSYLAIQQQVFFLLVFFPF